MSENGVCPKEAACTENSFKSYQGSSLNYRPRGSLARILYEKQKSDVYLSQLDKHEWYECDLEKLDPLIRDAFIKLEPDSETARFLERSEQKSDWIFTQIWHSVVKAFLGWFMTQTSINGWLQRGSMFVLSLNQFLKLNRYDGDWKSDTIVDLGAGDGEVTAQLAPLFKEVYVTEVSPTMQKLLERHGYRLLDIDKWHEDQKFDVISCLNLLDRCDTPLKLLRQIKKALKPNGRLLLAVVLPFSSYVESGSSDHKPKETLQITGKTFEEQSESLVNKVLKPEGFHLVSWTRVPYLCEGDLAQSYYWLDDALFVLEAS